MDKQQYFAKLKDPRWQKKRLAVMERDGFRCRRCGDDQTTLNVHHCYYKWGMDPWAYPSASLLTLCEPCHEYETQYGKKAKQEFADEFAKVGLLSDDLDDFLVFIRMRLSQHDDPNFVFKIIQHGIRDEAIWRNACRSYLEVKADQDQEQKELDRLRDEYPGIG